SSAALPTPKRYWAYWNDSRYTPATDEALTFFRQSCDSQTLPSRTIGIGRPRVVSTVGCTRSMASRAFGAVHHSRSGAREARSPFVAMLPLATYSCRPDESAALPDCRTTGLD